MFRILFLTLFAVIAIVLILYVDFKSLRLIGIITRMLPLALSGGVVGVWFAGGTVSLGSLVGFVTILGIAARNGIMMLSHYRHLQTEDNTGFGRELFLREAEERLGPILMTALTTGLALVLLMIAGNISGQEIEYPMAFVILGGLITSAILFCSPFPRHINPLTFAPRTTP